MIKEKIQRRNSTVKRNIETKFCNTEVKIIPYIKVKQIKGNKLKRLIEIQLLNCLIKANTDAY